MLEQKGEERKEGARPSKHPECVEGEASKKAQLNRGEEVRLGGAQGKHTALPTAPCKEDLRPDVRDSYSLP